MNAAVGTATSEYEKSGTRARWRLHCAVMPVRYWFRCDICGVVPDDETRRSIGASTREDLFGELIEAMPGKWLVWHAGGLLGPRRYACPDHRKALLKSSASTTRTPASSGSGSGRPTPSAGRRTASPPHPDGTLTHSLSGSLPAPRSPADDTGPPPAA